MIWKSDLQKKLNELEKELALIKQMDFRIEMARLKTEQNSLRGLVNRKLSKQIEEEPEEEEKKNIKGMPYY